MTITNGYATSAQFFAFAIPNAGTSTGDDAVIEQIIESSSRYFDNETRRTFYARGETRYYDVPDTNTLYLDDDLLTVAKFTNGDGTEISSGDYLTKPYNDSPKYAVKIKDSSTVAFEFDSTNNGERAISISGSWGYSTSTPKDAEVAVLEIAKNVYHRRFGENETTDTTITAAGVVVTPNDIPASARRVIQKISEVSMTFSSSSIATGIAALSISGVTVKDITAIPERVEARDCPILFPSPDGWMAGGNGEPSEGPTTFGTSTTRLWTFNRIYKYIYLHAVAGSGRGLKDHISGLTGKADAILTAISTLNLTDVDVKNMAISEFGVLTDPAGNSFYGFTLDVTLRERLNN